MWKRLALLWNLVRTDARRAWFALRHPGTPGWFNLGVALLGLYLVSPIDLLPDAIPFIGVVDDLVLIPLCLRWLLRRLPPHVLRDAPLR